MKKSFDETRFHNKPNILLLGSQMAVAGAQHVLLNQADYLDRLGYPVTVAFLYDRDNLHDLWQSTRLYPILNLHFRTPGAGKRSNYSSFMAGLNTFYQLLRRERFQVIETFTHHSNLIGCPMAWLAGVPVRIASHHGRIDRMSKLLVRLHSWMVNIGIATWLVAVSRDVARQAIEEGVKPKRLALILNGVQDLDGDPQQAAAQRTELLPDPDGKLILSVGGLTFQKAHTYLLQAMPDVLARYPKTVLALAGEGPQHSALEVEAKQLGIQENVRFLGVRSDVPDLMRAADIFVLPSRSEGLPLVLLEAMRTGLPIIATDVPGVGDALETDRCGIIVPIEDSQALSEGLLRLLSDESLRSKLGQAARERFQQSYTLDIMMSHYLELMDPSTAI